MITRTLDELKTELDKAINLDHSQRQVIELFYSQYKEIRVENAEGFEDDGDMLIVQSGAYN
ncbi:hypothetical protein [Aliikangiella coralliicola]|uniref:Uncharacterized protein n=1 Tax=Aliikangiella coralliicola TaxID=2592383 RepID=A0A545UFH7_9GAMM|nr:hypothetical protein [Aliikangiella coralliicola]TQV88224.1 hypothetical protein FLL46_06770 [Aliikangiella coralliicola]